MPDKYPSLVIEKDISGARKETLTTRPLRDPLERRKQRRYSVAALVNFDWKDSEGALQRAHGITRDISTKGIYIFSDSRPCENADLEINVLFSSIGNADVKLRMRVQAVVIRVEPSSTVGDFPGFAVLNRIARLHPNGPIDDEDGVHG